MLRRSALALAPALSAAILASACGGLGAEDVQLVHDGGTTRVDATAGDDGSTSAEGGAFVDGARVCGQPDAGRACQENGAACVVDVECCSLRCAAGVCLGAGSCQGPNAVCTSRSACCSGRCEPFAGTTNRVCLDYCKPDGVACTRALDCCGMSCNGGVCGGALCGKEDATCTSTADCCSGVCTQNKCQGDDVTVCRSTGESCGDFGGDGGLDGGHEKCCGTCDLTAQRCAFGPGPCLAVGALCSQSSDCCRGTCAPGAGGANVCTAPCIADGASCAAGADCCSHHCNGSPGVCGAATTCRLLGANCGGDGDCCSGQCVGGSCGNNCHP